MKVEAKCCQILQECLNYLILNTFYEKGLKDVFTALEGDFSAKYVAYHLNFKIQQF